MGYDRITHQFKPTGNHADYLCDQTLRMYEGKSHTELRAMMTMDIFRDSKIIVQSLLRRFPRPKDDTLDSTIYEEDAPRETIALTRMAQAVRLSDRYVDMIEIICSRAVDDLCDSVQTVQCLLQWQHLNTTKRMEILKDFHSKIMAEARRYFGGYPNVALTLQPTKIIDFNEAAKRNSKGKKSTSVQVP